MIVRREAETVRVTVAPRYRFDRALRVADVELCPQDRTVADALPGRACEGLDGATRILFAEWRIAASLHPAARVKHVVAELDVLARDVRLIQAAAIVATDHTGIGRRPLRPVDPPILELHLLRRMVAGRQPHDERGDSAGIRVHHHDA